jgi:secreted Zn-dependent insulinase-like peptidase
MLFGFNNIIDKMILVIMEKLFTVNYQQIIFTCAKESYQSEIEEKIYSPPYERIDDIVENTFWKKSFDDNIILDKLSIFNDFEMNNFIIMKDISLQCIIHGNVSNSQIENMYNIFNNVIKKTKYEITNNIQCNNEIQQCSKCSKCNIYNIIHLNKKEDNVLCCYVINTKQLLIDTNKFMMLHALVIILQKILSNKFFDEMRTKSKLGYIVNSSYDIIGNKSCVLCQKYYIQSSKFSVEKLANNMRKFFIKMKNYISTITYDELQIFINSCVSNIIDKKEKLCDETKKMFEEILHERYNFNYKKELIEKIKVISLQSIILFYNNVFFDKYANIKLINLTQN